jgi:hypothetical protein
MTKTVTLSTVNGVENIQVSNITKTTDMMLVNKTNFITKVVCGNI